MMYETTTCCSKRQFRVKPMNSGVFSSTWGSGGAFHAGIGGRSAGDFAEAARGKLSTIGGGGSDTGL